MPSQVARAGDRAFLLTSGRIDAATLHAYAESIRRRPGVLACITGQESLYVVFDHEPEPDEVALDLVLANDERSREHRIIVSFAEEHGVDLSEFLALHRLSLSSFLDRVATTRLTARFLGFRAGFAYLDGWPDEWHMPRRPTSRPRVPRGSFGIAGAVAGFYPIDTPGGWNVLGRTDEPLWDARRHPPNLIAAGDEITIVPTLEPVHPPPIIDALPGPAIDGIWILRNAQFTRVVTPTDWSGTVHGIPPGGPFDEAAAQAANQLAGNPPDAPLLECAMTGPRIRFEQRHAVAWVGAACDLPQARRFVVAAGDELAAGGIRDGFRGWLAVGPAEGKPRDDAAAQAPRPGSSDRLQVHVMAGPHATPLRTIECEVTAQLNRVGIRVRPLRPVGFAPPADLPSCGMQQGTLQLHPDGTIVAMGPDHPVTGGYLQPLTVRWSERWKLAQLSPGERVTFVCD